MDNREMTNDDVEWIHVAQDTAQFRAFVNVVMNLRVCVRGWGIS
jgi:hypothetical protein